MMIDPGAARRRKETAAREARVTRFQEYSGNAAISGRELPPDEVLAASQHIDATARALRHRRASRAPSSTCGPWSTSTSSRAPTPSPA